MLFTFLNVPNIERHFALNAPENKALVKLHAPNNLLFKRQLAESRGKCSHTSSLYFLTLSIEFKPSPGASGYQISNPSVVDLASLCAALSVFNQTSMSELRKKSVHLTAYLEHLLLSETEESTRAFRIITPSDPAARGTQLSVLLKPEGLEMLSDMLEDAGIVCDKRKPDVIRVAPVPLYNTYVDVWHFVQIFTAALAKFQ